MLLNLIIGIYAKIFLPNVCCRAQYILGQNETLLPEGDLLTNQGK